MLISGLLVVSLVTLDSSPAVEPPSMLDWVAPPGCPSAEDMQRAIEAAAPRSQTRVHANVVQRGEDHWVVEITMPGAGSPGGAAELSAGPKRLDESAASAVPTATRTIAGESCVAVSRAVVVAVALASRSEPRGAGAELPNPPASVEPSPEQPTSADGPSNPPIPARVSPRASEAARAPVAPLRDSTPASSASLRRTRSTNTATVTGRLAIAGRVGYGPLPATAGAIAGMAGLEGRRWWIDVGVEHWFRSFTRLPGSDNSGADLSLTAGSLQAGPRFGPRNVVFEFGPRIQLGALAARPRGALRERTALRPWVALGTTTGVRWQPRTWVSLGLDAALMVPLVRHRYVLQATVIHQARAVGIEGGVTVRFALGARTQRRSMARTAQAQPFRAVEHKIGGRRQSLDR